MISILVVDHDHAQRAATRTHLELAGYEVMTAKSGSEAMLMLGGRHKPALIVSQVPEGLDLCKRFRDDEMPGVPVVLVSETMLSEGDRTRVQKLGALELIERSADFKRELTWIRVAVQQVMG
jgi:CheY-like chemotaxis protein